MSLAESFTQSFTPASYEAFMVHWADVTWWCALVSLILFLVVRR